MKNKNFWTVLIACTTVFVSSASIMIIELVASRLIARYLGSSLYTWTSVIGVVLAGITIGNYIGGRLADRFHPRKTLSTLFLLSSSACVQIIVANNLVGDWIWLWTFSWPVRVFTHVCLVFLFPSILLGTIGPVVATMALKTGLPTGRTVGTIYAWGAAGSIAGTFLAGFYLIAALGTVRIIWLISGLLLLMGILYFYRNWLLYIWAVLFVALMSMGMTSSEQIKNISGKIGLQEPYDPAVIYDRETPYCHVRVRQISQNPDRREFLQDKLKHSELTIGDFKNLHYYYTQVFAALTHEHLKLKEIDPSFLVIGGGGYVFPQYLKHHFPNFKRIVVAEIDPGVTEAAHTAFALPRDTPIQTVTLDARNYIDELIHRKKTGGEDIRFDFIYEDAINDYYVPFQLVTKEFNEKIKELLSEDGLYFINLIDTYENAQFLGAIVHTIEQTFPYVSVITNKETFSQLRETFVVVAAFKPIDPTQMLLAYDPLMHPWVLNEEERTYLKAKASGLVLTDDYAPVETLLKPVVRQSGKELLATKYIEIARILQSKNRLEQSIEYFRKAADNNPSMTIFAFNQIGAIYVQLNQLPQAIEAFQKAVNYFYSVKGNQKIIGSIHMNLGILYSQLNENQKAAEQFNLAVEQFREEIKENPNNPTLFSRLGNVLAMLGRYADASEAFRQAHHLDPQNHQFLGELIRSLLMQNRTQEAVPLIRRQIEQLKKEGNTAAAAQMEQAFHQLLQ